MTKVLNLEEIDELLQPDYHEQKTKKEQKEFTKNFCDIFRRAMFLCAKAQSEGLLSLEDVWNEEKSDNRDILEYGLRLVIDGTEDSIINKILSNIINQEQDEQKHTLKTIQKEAVLAIQSRYHPRVFAFLLNSYTDIPLSDPEFKKSIDEAYNKMREWRNRTSNKCTLEKLTIGLQEGKLTVIASRPGIGKTRLAFMMAKYMACVKEKQVAFFSLEISKYALRKRFNGIELGVECRDLGSNPPFDIVDNPHMTFSELERYIRDLCGEKKIKAVFIDYLGLLANGTGVEGRKKEEAKTIVKLKNLAKELSISVIVVSQLPRNCEDASLQIIPSKLYFDEDDICIIDELVFISKFLSQDTFEICKHSGDNNWTKEIVHWAFPV